MEKKEIKLNDNELKVLTFLAEGYDRGQWKETGYYCFQSISNIIKLNRKEVRLACRSLKRKGLAEYLNGLWSDDGPAGAGYGATEKGAAYISHCDNCDKLNHYEYWVDNKGQQNIPSLCTHHIKECKEHYNKSKNHPATGTSS